MLSGIATVPTKDDLPTAKKLIDIVILLKTFLHLLPDLVAELEGLLPPGHASADGMDEDEEGDNDTLLLKAIIAALSPPVSLPFVFLPVCICMSLFLTYHVST